MKKPQRGAGLAGAILLFAAASQAQIFFTDTAIGPTNTNYDNQDIVVFGCTLTVDGAHTFSDVLIAGGGELTHSPCANSFLTNEVPGGLNLTVQNNFIVDSGSAVVASGLNVGASAIGGAGQSVQTNYPFGGRDEYLSGGGGGHGGYGARSLGGAAGGTVYGSPTIITNYEMGSSGGAGYGPGGDGGGLVRLQVGGVALVDGIIMANGADATNSAAGGGSGGSIWISAEAFAGSGAISARGGAGELDAGGGGGGGRVVIVCQTNDFSGALSAAGGPGAAAGGAGAVYFTNQQASTLLVDNGGLMGAATPLAGASFGNLTVAHGALAVALMNEAVNNLLIAAGGELTSSNAQLFSLTVSASAEIDAGGSMVFDGVSPGAVGAGAAILSNGVITGAGGGNGGSGGVSASGAAGGVISYESLSRPTNPGGRGGSGYSQAIGGLGGGALTFNVAKNLTLNGRISVNGAAGAAAGSGGGAGGSIFLTAHLLTGSGAISANGGAGEAGGGGGGGGGAIAIDAVTNQFIGAATAYGGAGFQAGGAGAVYFGGITQLPSSPYAKLIFDNDGVSGATTPLPSFPPDPAGDLIVTNGAVLKLTGAPEYNLHNLVIGSNAIVTATNSTTSRILNISGSARIDATGMLDLDGAGDAPGEGPYTGRSFVISNITSGSGAGNAGYGGANAYGIGGGGASGQINGQDLLAGSGGGSVSGGRGGGALSLNVISNLEINGLITANGLGAQGFGGGGAGGSIYLSAKTLSGEGAITVNGGAGGLPLGGGGGGGQIYIKLATDLFTGTMTAYGGAGAMYGGAGIIYAGTNRTLVDNGGNLGTNTPSVGFNEQGDLTVANGARLVGGSQAEWRNLLITSNAFIVPATTPSGQEAMELNLSGSLTIDAGGGIILDGAVNTRLMDQLGEGASRQAGAITAGSGGGHGGYGGTSGTDARGGMPYDVVSSPQEAGAAGGAGLGFGGAGGGAVSIHAEDGTVILNGIISANGLPGPGVDSGGGSGGAVNLQARTLTGQGTISVNGGSGNLPLGGGGAGGRIAVSATTNTFTGTFSARGGAGFQAGGAGTVWLSFLSKTAPYPKLIIDNGGQMGSGSYTGQFPNADLTLAGGASLVCGGQMTCGNLFIGSNSFLRPYTDTLNLQASNLAIQVGGGIDFDAAPGEPMPGTVNQPLNTVHCGPGGGNGGCGGASGTGLPGGAASAGSMVQPASLGGEGGYNSLPGIFTPGGGVLTLRISGLSTIDGSISANGGSATNNQAGGGAGGSIWLTTQGLAGAGLISANGGSGQLPYGGGGGGGRIALYFASNQFSGHLSAMGGPGFVAGGAGTIYQAANTANYGLLTLDNGGLIGTNTPLSDGYGNASAPASDLRITGGAIAVEALTSHPGVALLTFRSLLIDSNSVLTQPAGGALNFTVTGDATVAAGGAITVDGEGSSAGAGPGEGLWGKDGGGGGGGYGGAGGDSIFGGLGGQTYGSSISPTSLGSGGAAGSPETGPGSGGGGAAPLQVGGTLTVNGVITANGQPAEFPGAGGGSGGSVWLAAKTLAGSGVISANGGAGDPGAGGGGGGGRIAIYYLTNDFTGSLAVSGGAGSAPGQAGTLVLSTNASPLPMIAQPAQLRGGLNVSDGSVTLRWAGAAELTYQAQCSTNLIDWIPCGAPIIGSNGVMSISAAPTGPAQFFRIISRN